MPEKEKVTPVSDGASPTIEGVQPPSADTREDLGDLVARLTALPEITPAALPPTILSVEPIRSSRLIEGSGQDSSPVEVGKEPIVVRSSVPTFLSYVEVHGPSTAAENLVVEFQTRENTWRRIRTDSGEETEGRLIFHVGEFARQVRFSKQENFLFKAPRIRLKGVNLVGFQSFGSELWEANFQTLQDLFSRCQDELEADLAKSLSLKSTLEAEKESQKTLLAQQKDEHVQKCEQLEARAKKLKREISEATASLDELTEKHTQATALRDKSVTELASIDKQLAEKSQKFREESDKLSTQEKNVAGKIDLEASLNRSIADKRNQLDELNRDISLFAVNLKGYGSQGTKQIVIYSAAAGFSVGLGILLTIFAFQQVDQIWREVVPNPEKFSWSLIAILRLNIFVVFAAVIGAVSALILAFIRRIMAIGDRSLRLSEISILAKDVTEATLSETGATPEQKLSAFFAVRMMLIRNLLSGTFERLKESHKEEKEKLLQGLGDSDAAAFLRIISDLGLKSKEPGKKE